MKETQVSSNGWIHSMWNIHTIEYYSASKEGNFDACYNMNKPCLQKDKLCDSA